MGQFGSSHSGDCCKAVHNLNTTLDRVPAKQWTSHGAPQQHSKQRPHTSTYLEANGRAVWWLKAGWCDTERNTSRALQFCASRQIPMARSVTSTEQKTRKRDGRLWRKTEFVTPFSLSGSRTGSESFQKPAFDILASTSLEQCTRPGKNSLSAGRLGPLVFVT